MFLLNLFIHLLTTMFLVGLVGSAVVVTLAFVQDIGVLFGRDAEPEGLPAEIGHSKPAAPSASGHPSPSRAASRPTGVSHS